MKINSINPATQEILKSYTTHSKEQVNTIIDSIYKNHSNWRKTDFKSREKILKSIAAELLTEKKSLAILMAKEMGKPINDGIAEIEKCAWVCNYYAENGAKFLSTQKIKTEHSDSFISFQPIGIVLAVMPWNYPFWQVFRFLAPSIIVGNSAVLKHASNVPGCALAIEKLVHKAGLPKNVFKTLLVESKSVKAIIENKKIAAVTLTGSTEAGKDVASIAGSVIKKTVLELGGSDPYIILEDANLNNAVENCVASRLLNNGQSCISAKRFIVLKSIADEFIKKVVEKMSSYNFGNPLDEKTILGPMSRQDLRDDLHKQVLKNIRLGAKCLLGGKLPKDAKNNAFYPPTVLVNIKKGMPAYTEEMFGPVASILIAKNEQDAIEIANDTDFGLGAAVFSKNKTKAKKIATEEIQSGAIAINSLLRSDPRLPFGGVKTSGYGREMGLFGIYEFVNIKSITVD